jgi:hypothetical protein
MKTKKLIRYRLAVSRVFPATHNRAGEPTFFIEKILKSTGKFDLITDDIAEQNGFYLGKYLWIEHRIKYGLEKIHTIRSNYQLWKKRFEKINRGEAVLELYYWEKPGGCYVEGNKQIVFCQLSKNDGIGIQELYFYQNNIMFPRTEEHKVVAINLLEHAKNDGLSLDDFKEWFKNYNLSVPMAIIHLTNFRY